MDIPVADRDGLEEGVMAVLEIRDARKDFGSTRALDGLSLSLGEGELLGLLGPNGAGKTTLIRAISGRVRLNAGTVTLYGRTLEPGVPRPNLGVVPQDNALYPLLLTTHYLEEAEARCERIVIVDRGRAIAAGTLPELVEQAGLAGRRVRLSLDRPLAERDNAHATATPAGFTRGDDARVLTATI